MRIACAFVLVLFAAGSAGCVAGPRVAVERARWAESSEEASVLHIAMEVSNPGSRPIELRELHYGVRIDGRHVYTGRRAAAMTLAPRTAALVEVPAVVRREDTIAPEPARFSVSGSAVFVSPGRLALVMRDLGLPRPRAGFRGSGEVSP